MTLTAGKRDGLMFTHQTPVARFWLIENKTYSKGMIALKYRRKRSPFVGG